MPRPRPLANVSSARASTSEYQALTPRTPHSRAGRAEEAYQPAQLDLDDEGETRNDYTEDAGHHQQSLPLLSSADDRFPSSGPRSTGDGKGLGKFLDMLLSNLPVLAGSLLASALLFLAVVSYNRPGTLERYVGIGVPGSSDSDVSESILEAGVDILQYNSTEFPLPPGDYVPICWEIHNKYSSQGHGRYWDKMPNVDVPHKKDDKVCSSTITYMLDGRIGLVSDLALIAQAAALARERNRTFLIDDTFWDRGKWNDHFEDVRILQPGPEPGCKPPPPEEYVPCPRTARHWVINSHTGKFHFSHGFEDYYDNPYGHGLNRKKPAFKMSTESFQNTIRPNQESARLIRAARNEFYSFSKSELANYISVHIRRGDHKLSFYNAAEMPISEYVSAVSDTWSRLGLSSKPLVYVASDSPDALNEIEQRTDLNVFSLAKSVNPELRALASPQAYFQKDFDDIYELDERAMLTKGMVVDLALVSGFWSENDEVALTLDAVVCTTKSAVCKMSAVGLGWDKAFGTVDILGDIDTDERRWVEIDENGRIIPVWMPFNLF